MIIVYRPSLSHKIITSSMIVNALYSQMPLQVLVKIIALFANVSSSTCKNYTFCY